MQGIICADSIFDIFVHQSFSHINLPVLPQGLQIMADQGFEHNFPVLVLPQANQPQISKDICRYVPIPSTFQHQHSYLYYFVTSVLPIFTMDSLVSKGWFTLNVIVTVIIYYNYASSILHIIKWQCIHINKDFRNW